MTVTCRRCGHAVDVPRDDATRQQAAMGAHLLCDSCGADLGSYARALGFVAGRGQE